MDYSVENWKTLGAWIKRRRLNAGYADITEWADAIKRSTRQARGLERGEPVGPKTLQAVADALLGGDPGALYELLDPEGNIATVDVVFPKFTAHPGTVRASEDDVPTLLYRKPDELTDDEWRDLIARTGPIVEWEIEQALRRRREQ